MTTVTRRSVLGGALGAAGALVLSTTGCSASGGVDLRSGVLRSRHWPGQDVHWQVAMPPRFGPGPRQPSPVVVVLHGKGGDSSHAFRILHLDDHVAATGLTVAAVDGGDFYWHARRGGVDTGAMVVDDFVPMVRRLTGYAGRLAFLGWSMGGYGSLLLASQLGQQHVGAVVAESAALWTSPGDSAPGAFDDRADFEAHDVFARTRVLGRIPVRLDCGRSDPFASANQAFSRALPGAELTLDAGAHTSGYWRDHGGAQLAWIARHLTAAGTGAPARTSTGTRQ
jgi:pimeloyl-ACP methyl ester carboxylesterase